MKILRILIILFLAQNVWGQFGIPWDLCNCASNIDARFFRIEHYHKIPGHTRFANRQLIAQACSSVEFRGIISVVADGTTSTYLEITKESCDSPASSTDPYNLIQLDDVGNQFGNSFPNMYGTITKTGKNGATTYFKYTHPLIGPDEGVAFREIFVQIGFGSTTQGIMIIRVYRPPVLMVHGLWSKASAFVDMEEDLISSGNYVEHQLHSADYESTNDRSFSTNNTVVPLGIYDLIKECQTNFLAAGKVNVVCHSMGGILTRLYMNQPLYTNNNDIYRLITCNTPHAGSQMANFLLDATQYGTKVASLLNLGSMSSNNGAVSDLRVGYPIINSVEAAAILGDAKAHAIVTVTDPLSSPTLGTVQRMSPAHFMMALMLKHCGNAFLEDIFDDNLHDAIVAQESQQGGLPSLYLSVYSDQVHMGSVANGQVMDRVNELLNEPITTQHFSNDYFDVNIMYDFNVPCLPFRGRVQTDDRMTAAVEITAPVSNTYANGGDTLIVHYNHMMVDSVMAMMHTHPDSISVLYVAANGDSLLFPTPPDLFGPHTLILAGMDMDGSIQAMDSVTIQFGTIATLDSILISPNAFYLNQTDSSAFTIQGIYSDSVTRNLMFDDSLDFAFFFDHASRRSTNFIRLDSLESDTLVVSKNGAVSRKVVVHKTGTNYSSNCKTVMNTLSDGIGSLKQALDCAEDGDTIAFDASLSMDTILVDTQGLEIDKTIYFINSNTEKVFIKSAASAVFITLAGYEVYFENLGIISTHADAVVINNYGSLTLKNVDCRNMITMIPSKLLNGDEGEVTVIGEVKF